MSNDKIDPLSLPTRAKVRIARDTYFANFIVPLLLKDDAFAKELYERAAAHPDASRELCEHLARLARQERSGR